MTPTQYLRVFVRFWWLIGLCTVLGILVTGVLSSWASSTYTSSASVLVSTTPVASTSADGAYTSTLLAQERMATYATLADGPAVLKDLGDELDLKLTSSQLKDRIDVEVPEKSTVLNIVVRDSDRDRAQVIAGAVAASSVKIINRLESVQGPQNAFLRARVTTPAGAATTATAAPAWRTPVLGAVAGLLIGLGLAVVASRFDRRQRLETTVREVLAAPVLAVLPEGSRAGRSSEEAWTKAVRELRTSIYFEHPGADRCLTVSITSPQPVDGLAQLGGDVAAALADTGARVLLIQADLHDSRQPPLLNGQGDESAGLAAYLSGATPAEGAIWRDTSSGVDVVPAGFEPANAADLLHSEAFATLLDDVATRYEFVLVTTPATSRGTDAAAVAARCDGTVLVVTTRTKEAQVRATGDQLGRVDAHILGVAVLS